MSFSSSSSSLRSSILLRCLSRPGPSRLASRQTPCRACLREASTSTDAEAEVAGIPPTPSSVDAAGREAATSDRMDASVSGYSSWLQSVAAKYHGAPDNGPKWLGGSIPYATNPSFRPPPPISDAVKERIYQIYFHSATKSKSIAESPSVAQISEAFNISKKRVEAILRLKILEKEWEHANKPLQTPFQEKMERYLGARQIKAAGNKLNDVTISKAEREARSLHPAAALEFEEEAAHEAFENTGASVSVKDSGDQDNSAFTARDTLIRDPRMERAVWEFRSEESGDYESTRPGGKDALDVPFNRVLSAEETTRAEAAAAARRAARALKLKALEQENLGERIKVKLVSDAPAKDNLYKFQDVKKRDEAQTFSPINMGKRQNETGKRDKQQKRKERVAKAIARAAEAGASE